MIFRMFSASIRLIALSACLTLILPASAILQEMAVSASGVTASHACMPSSATDESSGNSGHPAKPCPMLEFRAALALLSVKSPAGAKTTLAASGLDEGLDFIEPVHSRTGISSHPHISANDLSLLRVLRI